MARFHEGCARKCATDRFRPARREALAEIAVHRRQEGPRHELLLELLELELLDDQYGAVRRAAAKWHDGPADRLAHNRAAGYGPAHDAADHTAAATATKIAEDGPLT